MSSDLTPEDVEEILRLLDDSQFSDLEIESKGMVISLRRRRAVDPGSATGPAEGTSRLEVISPTPGIFYRAPQAGQPPFVEVGSSVSPDTVVCIIEVMKLMNPIEAGVEGKIAEVCVSDGAEVSEGQLLFRVASN